VTPIYADDSDLEAIRARVLPVREELRADPEAGRFLEHLELLANPVA
jgi:hypothetical protein